MIPHFNLSFDVFISLIFVFIYYFCTFGLMPVLFDKLGMNSHDKFNKENLIPEKTELEKITKMTLVKMRLQKRRTIFLEGIEEI